MKKYYYPSGMNMSPVFLFWSLRDIIVIISSVVISILILVTSGTFIPLALSLLNAFLSIRTEEKSINDYLRLAFKYIFMQQKTYIYKNKETMMEQ